MKTPKPNRKGFKSLRASKIWPGTRYTLIEQVNVEIDGTRMIHYPTTFSPITKNECH